VTLRSCAMCSRPTSPGALHPAGYANGFMSLTGDARLIFFSDVTLAESKGDDYRYDARYWDIWTIDDGESHNAKLCSRPSRC